MRLKNVHVSVISGVLRWTEFVGGIEQILNTQQNLLYGDTWFPVVTENREANGTAWKNVGVEETRRELACEVKFF